MRGVMALGGALAVLAGACDRGTGALTAPAGTAPRFAAGGNGATVSTSNNRYLSQGESFPLCNGSYATGDITWHEVDQRVDYPDGSYRMHIHLNMLGGRATGLDGTVYVLKQVNKDERTFEATSNTFDLQGSARIAVISPGRAQNLFYEDTIRLHIDPVNGVTVTHTLTVVCRG